MAFVINIIRIRLWDNRERVGGGEEVDKSRGLLWFGSGSGEGEWREQLFNKSVLGQQGLECETASVEWVGSWSVQNTCFQLATHITTTRLHCHHLELF